MMMNKNVGVDMHCPMSISAFRLTGVEVHIASVFSITVRL